MEEFCRQYIIDYVASKAVVRAGYSKSSAGVRGFQLLRNPKVQERIRQLQREQTVRTQITADRVVSELAKVAFANIKDFLDNTGDLHDMVGKLTHDQAACISEVNEVINKKGGKRIKLKFHDKMRALELLGRHLGIFFDDHVGPVVAQTNITNTSIVVGELPLKLRKLLLSEIRKVKRVESKNTGRVKE